MTWPSKKRPNERGEVELLRALLRLAHQLQSNLEFEAVVRVVATAASETFGFGEAAVFVREPGGVLRAHATVEGGVSIDLDSFNVPLQVEAVERLFTDRHSIGEGYFLAGNDPDWEAAGLSCLAARGPSSRSAWKKGDTLLIPLRDQRKQLSGLLRLGSPMDGGKPTLQTVSLLSIFATHAVVAIDNAWEHRELQRVTSQLEDELRLHHDLAEVSRSLLAELDQQAVFDEIARALGQMVHYETIAIALAEHGKTELMPAFASPPEAGALMESTCSVEHPLVASVVRERKALLVDSDHDGPLPFTAAGESGGAMILTPLAIGDDVFGVLSLGRPAGQRFNAREFELTELFANLAAIAVQNARTYREMERLATSDGLTGMHNYRHFREALASEARRAERYDEVFCLLRTYPCRSPA